MEKEELKNNNQTTEYENTNREPAAKLSDVGKTMLGTEDIEKSHTQEILDCPEGTPEQKYELTKTLKDVEKMAKLATAKNDTKEVRPNSEFSKSQQVEIKQQKKTKENQVDAKNIDSKNNERTL